MIESRNEDEGRGVVPPLQKSPGDLELASPGICMSRNTRSGSCGSTAPNASMPLLAWVDDFEILVNLLQLIAVALHERSCSSSTTGLQRRRRVHWACGDLFQVRSVGGPR